MICSSSDSSISSSDEYALSSEWAMSRVARALARARVLMERGFVSRRVARFEAPQASLCARDGRPVTRVWCDGVVCRAVVCVGRRVRSRACRQLDYVIGEADSSTFRANLSAPHILMEGL